MLAPRQCHDGWTRFQNFCYRTETLRLTWTSARHRCLQYGGDLISLHSPDEFNFILTLANAHHLMYSAFSGLNDRNTEGGYVWSDGSPVQYTNWGVNQPDNFHSQEDCVEVFGDGTWNDVSCGEMRHFGCKISVGKSSKLSLLCSLLCRVYMLDKDVKQLPTFFAPYGRRSSYLSLY